MIANVLVALLMVASILGVAWSLSKRRRAGPALVSLPRELREARLVYVEKLFAATGAGCRFLRGWTVLTACGLARLFCSNSKPVRSTDPICQM